MKLKNIRLIGIMLLALAILSIPFFAMRFSIEGVDWDARDFIVMGILLLGTGSLCEFVLRIVKKMWHRVAMCAAILIALFLIWAELAVGIFGTPFAGS